MFELTPDYLSPEELWTLLESATDGLWTWDIQRDEIRWSPSVFETLGYPESADAAFTDILDILHPDDAAAFQDGIRRHLEDEVPYRLRVRLRQYDGSYLWVETRGLASRDPEGRPTVMTGYLVDITRARDAQEALRLSEQRFRAFMDNSPVAAFMKGADGTHLYVNRAAAEIAGTTPEAMLGRSNREIFPPETASELDRVDREVLSSGRVLEWTGFLERADGSRRWVHDVKFPVEVEAGVMALGGKGLDLTDLREAQEAADAADRLRSLGQLAGGIAHDFNNMLSVILGFARLARDQVGADHPADEGLQEVIAAAERSARLTEQLLGFARRQPVHPRVLDLGSCVEEAFRFLQRMIGENVELELEIADELHPVRLDRGQLDQILTNLCVNARDAIQGTGTVTIALEQGTRPAGPETTPTGQPGARAGADPADPVEAHGVLLTVRDTGEGMDEETLGRVFEPFFTTKEVGKGSGLGLSTVYGIVQQNGGHIQVESEPGQGTTFRIWLPGATESADPSPVVESEMVAAPRRARVAVVEDEPALLRLTGQILDQLGYEALLFPDPLEALAALEGETTPPAALVTDVVMPGMSGAEVSARLRQRFPGLPVVFVSGYAEASVADEAGGDDGTVFLTKPFRMEQLAQALGTILD